jgi:hypothetical protein
MANSQQLLTWAKYCREQSAMLLSRARDYEKEAAKLDADSKQAHTRG